MISARKLQKILLKKAQAQTLGHFYILTPGNAFPQTELALKDWALEFVAAYMHQEKILAGADTPELETLTRRLKQVGHPDVLVFGPERSSGPIEGETKDYQVKELAPFFQFLNLRPFELSHRFVIMEGAHHIPEIVGNKLLKTFEEPGEKITVFLLHPLKTPLLSTIKGRAQVLKLLPEQNSTAELRPSSQAHAFLDWLKEIPSTPFTKKLLASLDKQAFVLDILELFKGNPEWEEEFVHLCLDWQRLHPTDFASLRGLLKQLENWEQSLVFHNSRSGRLFSLFPYLPLQSR